jgi:pimeloyl-ACP methyl ester carboxylesterase
MMKALLLSGFVAFAVLLPSGSFAKSIDESRFVPIGGIDQWISIRGENVGNPVLLVVHGGPGEAQWPAAEKYTPWEKAFTLVQWDQRGAGHTFGRYGTQTPQVKLEQIAKDGVELAAYLCRTLDKKKVIVLGHSSGSIVAIRMVQMRPQLFAAYVGTGQVASWKASVNAQFGLLLEKARRDGDEAKVKELEAIGQPDPNNAAQYFSFSKGLRQAMAPADQEWLRSMRARLPELQAREPREMQNLEEGMNFSGEQLLPEQMAANLPASADKIDTAFFVIQGRNDVVTPTAAAVDYFNHVQTSEKELILIPDAGHFAFVTASDKFLAALPEKVRPAAIKRGA